MGDGRTLVLAHYLRDLLFGKVTSEFPRTVSHLVIKVGEVVRTSDKGHATFSLLAGC